MFVLPATLSAEAFTEPCSEERVVVYRQYTLSRSMGLEPFVEMGVGILALVLFAISAVAWWRDKRKKFLVVCLAFLVFTVKGSMGVLDLMFPGDSSILGTFSDLLDFVILFLLVVAVIIKE